MDTEKLDREVQEILAKNEGGLNYSEERERLIAKGYNPQELKYILGLVDEKLLSAINTGGEKKKAKRNMLIGGAIGITGLVVLLSSYFGQPVAKELNYIALVLFAVGYLVFRNGYKNRNGIEEEKE